MRFLVHNLDDQVVTEWHGLDKVPEKFKPDFDFLLEIGDLSMSCGKTVFEIKPNAKPPVVSMAWERRLKKMGKWL